MVRRSDVNGARANCATEKSMPPLIEVRSENERVEFQQARAELLRGFRPVDLHPVDHHFLVAET